MSERVTDFTTAILRLTWADYSRLTNKQREFLRVYASASGEDAKTGVLWFEVANYRVEEITSGLPS